MPSPEAVYDSLRVVRQLEGSLRGVTPGEIQLFTYLARLLALFGGSPSEEWGYRFAMTQWGTPFSSEISEAIDELRDSGRFCMAGDEPVAAVTCTDEGRLLCEQLDGLENCSPRRPILEAACSSSLAFPVASIRSALRAEPTIRSASLHTAPQELLAGPSLEVLYEQFEALRQALSNQSSDLFVPSVVWLSYLIENRPGLTS